MAYSGSDLKKIREGRNISLEQVASATRIRLAILQDLEDEEYSELSSSTQTKGFLKLYADFLGLEDEAEPEVVVATAAPQTPSDTLEVVQPVTDSIDKKIVENVEPTPQQTPTIKQPLLQDTQDEATKSEEPSESAEDLMAIGRELAARRRYLNVTWDVIEEETHIPENQLRNIERGDLDAFINPMQFRGLLQAYTRFLNLDVAAIMIRYADAIQKRRTEKSSSKKRTVRPIKVLPPFLVNLRRFFTLDLFFGTLMIVGIVGFLIWGISRMTFLQSDPEPTGTLPAVADILLSEPTVIATPIEATGEEESVQMIPTSTPFYIASETESNLEIVLLIRQNTWLRVTSDREVLFQGRQSAGNVLTYTGEEQIELETGNIAAIEIIFNQQSLEPISDVIGTPARLLFSAEGMAELPIVDLPED